MNLPSLQFRLQGGDMLSSSGSDACLGGSLSLVARETDVDIIVSSFNGGRIGGEGVDLESPWRRFLGVV